MGQVYQLNKVHIYNWVEKNRERHNEINKMSRRRIVAKRKAWEEIRKEFLNILL